MKKNTGIIIIGAVALILCGVIGLTTVNTNTSTFVPANPVTNNVAAKADEQTPEPTATPTPEPVATWTEEVQFGNLTLKSVRNAEQAAQMSFQEIWEHIVATNYQAVSFVHEGDERLTDINAEESFLAQWETTGELGFLRANQAYVGLFEDNEADVGEAILDDGKVVGISGGTVLNWWVKTTRGWALAEEFASRLVFKENTYGSLTSFERSPFTKEGAIRYGSAVRLLKVDDDHYVWVVVVSKGADQAIPAAAPSGGNTPENSSIPSDPSSGNKPENNSQPAGDPVAEGAGEEGASNGAWDFERFSSTETTGDENTGSGKPAGSTGGWNTIRYSSVEITTENTGSGSTVTSSDTGSGATGGASSGWDTDRNGENSTPNNDL